MENNYFNMPVNSNLKKSQRLLEKKQYKHVFAKHLRIVGVGFIVIARLNREVGARLGLSFSKRHCPRAVERNRLKRIARESFRISAKQLPSVDIIIFCTYKSYKFSNKELFSTLSHAWLSIMSSPWVEY